MRGRDALVDSLEQRRSRFGDALVMHVVTNTLITEQATDRANVVSYCQFYVRESRDVDWAMRTSGYYDDLFALTPQGWRDQAQSLELLDVHRERR